MRMFIQRVSHASVTVDHIRISTIQQGFLVLLGICQEDTKEIADKMLRKMLNLRIFSDENGKTNLSLKDVNGALLIVSQFTLYADCKKGCGCRYSDCKHIGEPGCAVIPAVEQSIISESRYASYLSILEELNDPTKYRKPY